MIHLATKLPIKFNIAVSGGPDSMALLDFAIQGRRQVNVIHIDHGTKFSKSAREFVEAYCVKHNIPYQTHVYNDYGMPANEEVWRNFRLDVYKQYTNKGEYVATAHHLDDLIEWGLLTFIHGKANYMKPLDKEHKLIKPFLYTEKEVLVDWCKRKEVPYLTDPTNVGDSNARAKMRASIIPVLLDIYPGMKTSMMNAAKWNSDVNQKG